jgi:lysophospholipase L1-like esterase
MNHRIRQAALRCLPLLALLLTGFSSAEAVQSPPTLYIVGDSTAAAYSLKHYPLFGWAQVLDYYFDNSKLQISDRAISGRSSKSFYDEGNWSPIREALQPGDFVFIQFGHNDEKNKDPKRFTDPASTYPEYLGRYIEETRKAQAIPILLTPINRNSWNPEGELVDTHGAYPDAVRKLAKTTRVPLIDMHKLTWEYFEKLGRERSTRLFINLPPGLYPVYPEGRPDNTHLQEQGAFAISALAIKAIRKQGLPLRGYLKKSHRSWGLSRRLQQKSDF